MESWLAYLRQGLSRRPPKDGITGPDSYFGIMKKLEEAMAFSHPALAERRKVGSGR